MSSLAMVNPTQHFAIRGDDGTKHIWYTSQLWRHAKELPVVQLAIDDIPALNLNTWFFGVEPTCRRVAEHARRMNAASLDFPIILSREGWVMDGMHRVCKALMLGHTHINAVQFPANPAPDATEPL